MDKNEMIAIKNEIDNDDEFTFVDRVTGEVFSEKQLEAESLGEELSKDDPTTVILPRIGRRVRAMREEIYRLQTYEAKLRAEFEATTQMTRARVDAVSDLIESRLMLAGEIMETTNQKTLSYPALGTFRVRSSASTDKREFDTFSQHELDQWCQCNSELFDRIVTIKPKTTEIKKQIMAGEHIAGFAVTTKTTATFKED